jgi:hypothetical protein
MPARILPYARVSTDDQERAGLSIPAQVRAMQQYGKAKGIVVAGVYQEADSAFSDESKRPEFWRMVERAKGDPQITGILVHDFSRFFRDPYAGPMVKGDLLPHGVRVVSVSEPEYAPRTIADLAIEKMTEFKNASYSLDVAFHTRKGMKESLPAASGACAADGERDGGQPGDPGGRAAASATGQMCQSVGGGGWSRTSGSRCCAPPPSHLATPPRGPGLGSRCAIRHAPRIATRRGAIVPRSTSRAAGQKSLVGETHIGLRSVH